MSQQIFRRNLIIALFINAAAFITTIAVISYANLTQDTGSWIRWTVQCFALLLVLPGMLRLKFRAYSWQGFIAMLYFIPAVLKFMSPQGDTGDTILLIATPSLAISAGYCSRWLQRLTADSESDVAEPTHSKTDNTNTLSERDNNE
ncbi:DUF2069 domain-containing protein [Aurantivibrio plasticivorans]